MTFTKPLVFALVVCGLSLPASAQIISQTPQPDIPAEEPLEIETIDRRERVGSTSRLIKVPRAGAFLFAGFDRNGDYVVDQSEVNSGIKTAFKRADKDGSGVLSLVELEGWRLAALGSAHASPSNYDFAPNFARTVSKDKFTAVLQGVAEKLDTDDQGERDGRIAMTDLLKDFQPPRGKTDDSQCQARIREARRRVQQQCRTSRGYLR